MKNFDFRCKLPRNTFYNNIKIQINLFLRYVRVNLKKNRCDENNSQMFLD